MADNLRRLVANETLRGLQERLNAWMRDYNGNSCDQNLNYCLELIEQVAKVQGQLFGILTVTAQEGGHNEGLETIKSRLLPWLETSFNIAALGKPVGSRAASLQDTYDRDRYREPGPWERDQQFDSELNSVRNQPNQPQDDLDETGKNLEGTKDTTISLMAAEEEINQLKKQLRSLQAQEEARHRNSESRRSESTRSERRASTRRNTDQLNVEWPNSRGNTDQQTPDWASSRRNTDAQSQEWPSGRRSTDQQSQEWSTASSRRNMEQPNSEWSSSRRSMEQPNPDWTSTRRTMEQPNPDWTSNKRNLDQQNSEWSSGRRNLEQQNPEVMSNYEKQLQNLKDEIAVLSAEKSDLQGRPTRSRSPSPQPCRPTNQPRSRSRSQSRSRSRSRSNSPSTAVAKIRSPSPNRSKLSSVARKAALLSRFSDAYSQGRLDAQCLLRNCIDRAETVQRIIYIATVEAFHVAKMAFRHFKIRVRKMLTPSYVGSNDFENAVSDYIVCHLELYDSQSSVNDVIRAMNVNPKISFPPEVDFCLLTDFIQEICCIAFAMQTLEPPLDIAFGADGEVFNDCKYRRSYDSDFAAPLVFYHVWPALMENECVIMKGEAVTRRGAFVRWPCIVTIHPQCLIHKFENIYKPKDSIKQVHKEMYDKTSYKGERKAAFLLARGTLHYDTWWSFLCLLLSLLLRDIVIFPE